MGRRNRLINNSNMSKDLDCKWNFVVRNESSQEQGREDSSFDYFKDKERCLVRERLFRVMPRLMVRKRNSPS